MDGHIHLVLIFSDSWHQSRPWLAQILCISSILEELSWNFCLASALILTLYGQTRESLQSLVQSEVLLCHELLRGKSPTFVTVHEPYVSVISKLPLQLIVWKQKRESMDSWPFVTFVTLCVQTFCHLNLLNIVTKYCLTSWIDCTGFAKAIAVLLIGLSCSKETLPLCLCLATSRCCMGSQFRIL